MDTIKAATKIYDTLSAAYFVYHPETEADLVIGLDTLVAEQVANAGSSIVTLGTTPSTVEGAIWIADS